MKRKIASFLFFINLTALSAGFSEVYGVFEKSSFNVFRSYDGDMFNVKYWQNQFDGNACIKTGFYDDAVNVAGTAKYFGAYWGLGYDAKIMGHGSWPDEVTDMDVYLMSGIPALNLGIKLSYYDKNVYKGIGVAAPKIEIGKSFDSFPLNLEFDCEGKFRYWHGMRVDVAQIPFTFKADFSKDGMRGFGVSYTVMPSIEGPKGINDVSGLHPLNGFSVWAGWFWNIHGNLKFGLRPNFMLNYNCINTTNYEINERLSYLHEKGSGSLVENLNWISENGNLEWRVCLPVSFVFNLTEKVDFVGGFRCGFYWANFSHLNEESEGGCNLDGLVNETGIGMGFKVEMNEHSTFQIGTAFVRQISVDADGNETGKKSDYTKNYPDLSLYNLAKSPITMFVTLKF